MGWINKDQIKRFQILKTLAQKIEANKGTRDQVVQAKKTARLEGSAAKVERLANKSSKIAVKLVKLVHKSKSKGRRGKTAKVCRLDLAYNLFGLLKALACLLAPHETVPILRQVVLRQVESVPQA